MNLLSTPQMVAKYGQAVETGPYLVQIDLPYPMKLAWDKTVSVTHLKCHKLEADRLKQIFVEILLTYKIEKIQELGIDLFGGCFNYRMSRNGAGLSRHSWGTAVDLDPERNQLHESRKTARFARPEYADMIAIFEENGWASLGKERDYDWMHFEAAE